MKDLPPERPYHLALFAADSRRREAAAAAARMASRNNGSGFALSLVMHAAFLGLFCLTAWQMPPVPTPPPVPIDMNIGLGTDAPPIELPDLPGLPAPAVAPGPELAAPEPAPAPDPEPAAVPLPEPVLPPPAPEPVPAPPPPEPDPVTPPPSPEPEPEPEPAPPEPTVKPTPAPAPVKVKPVPKPAPKPKPKPVPKPAPKPLAKPVAKPEVKPVPPSPEPVVKPAPIDRKLIAANPTVKPPVRVPPLKRPGTAKSAPESELERISRIRRGLQTSGRDAALTKAMAGLNGGGATGGGFDAQAIGNAIGSGVRNSVAVARFSSQGGGGATASQGASYFADLSARLHGMWNQPGRAEVGGGRPRATVSLSIANDGRVLGARITKGSGRPAMDASIQRLLSNLTRLAAPADFGITSASLTIVVNFELD